MAHVHQQREPLLLALWSLAFFPPSPSLSLDFDAWFFDVPQDVPRDILHVDMTNHTGSWQTALRRRQEPDFHIPESGKFLHIHPGSSGLWEQHEPEFLHSE